MPQQPADRQIIDFRAGLFTEGGYLNTPEGSTVDEKNFEILIDGSRRRRKGLDAEASHVPYSLPATLGVDDAVSWGYWKNAGGDADIDFHVAQIGPRLHFWLDSGTSLSSQKESGTIELSTFSVTGTAADYEDNPVSFASGNGFLLVCGRYIEPFYIEYDTTGGTFTATPFILLERDFHTLDDGTLNLAGKPATLGQAHEYNLRNRGWKDADITQFYADKSVFPALNMLWHMGYRRQKDGTATYIDEDGIYTWDSNKMDAQPFGSASAPVGSLLVKAWDTTEAYNDVPAGPFNISTWTKVSTTYTITTTDPHGMTHPANFTISGNEAWYIKNDLELGGTLPDPYFFSLDGSYTTDSTPTTTTFTFTKSGGLAAFNSWDDQYASLGAVSTGDPLANLVDGYSTNERPTVCGWYAGRAWFGGIRHPKLNDKLYFTNVKFPNDLEFGQCYQKNDPTDPFFNELLPDDGGTVVISDIGALLALEEFNGSWLAFTTRGVWEIKGGRGGFTADNYTVRKMSDNECTSKFSVCRGEGFVTYAGRRGIFFIVPDEQTGILYSRSITADKIQTAFNEIPAARIDLIKARYDFVNKKVVYLYSDTASMTNVHYYNRALHYDVRLDAWSKMTYPGTATNWIIDLCVMQQGGETGTYAHMKYVIQSATRTQIAVVDSRTDFQDWDNTEQECYLITAYDNIGSWAHQRNAPIVHVFMGKTETGFDGSLNPVNPSSLTMQARWNWSDNANANEWGTATQVYRHVRQYTPPDSSDTFNSGYPVVVTRNKVRGRGRSLHLKFTGADTYDAHLLGYAIRYKIGGRI